ncbi:unannotated protein [freshwater metagenome]|uniref:Unannotated protein n=1 Tax=freshwater metagenome TaxID=449393 RepID=A0A6J7E045_9ZZZZ
MTGTPATFATASERGAVTQLPSPEERVSSSRVGATPLKPPTVPVPLANHPTTSTTRDGQPWFAKKSIAPPAPTDIKELFGVTSLPP